jgi:type I restriction enzyme M protein
MNPFSSALDNLVDLVSNKINFADAENRKQNTLGRAYEYFISQFAGQEGRKGGDEYHKAKLQSS